jgi:hypothetical protein
MEYPVVRARNVRIARPYRKLAKTKSERIFTLPTSVYATRSFLVDLKLKCIIIFQFHLHWQRRDFD